MISRRLVAGCVGAAALVVLVSLFVGVWHPPVVPEPQRPAVNPVPQRREGSPPANDVPAGPPPPSSTVGLEGAMADAFGALVPCPQINQLGIHSVWFDLPPTLRGRYPQRSPWVTPEGFHSPLPTGRAHLVDGTGLRGDVVFDASGCTLDWDSTVTLEGRVAPAPHAAVRVEACGYSTIAGDDGVFSVRVPKGSTCLVAAIQVQAGVAVATTSELVADRDRRDLVLRSPEDDGASVVDHDEGCMEQRGRLAAFARMNARLPADQRIPVSEVSLCDPPLDEVPLSDVSPGVIGVLLDGDRVVHVEPASPAEGLLLVGDRLTAVNDVPVEPGDLTEALWGLPGESVTLTIDRGGRVDTFALERADRTAP
jgi:hypothetical protein